MFSSSLPSSSLLSVSSTNKGKIFSIFCVDILKAKVKVACFIFILKILNFLVRLVRHRLVLFSYCAGGRSLYLLIGNLPVEYANCLYKLNCHKKYIHSLSSLEKKIAMRVADYNYLSPGFVLL